MPDPKALSLDDIEELKQAWLSAVKRSLEAGFDVIEYVIPSSLFSLVLVLL